MLKNIFPSQKFELKIASPFAKRLTMCGS